MRKLLSLVASMTLVALSFLPGNINAMPSIQALKEQYPHHLFFSIPVKLSKLDPVLSLSAHARLIIPLIYESLVSINSDQELVPLLAKSWHVSSDLRSITINMHKGYQFSDGSEITSSDVINSFLAICSPGSQVSDHFKGIVGCVDHAHGASIFPGIHRLGKYQVEFNIDISPTNFLYEIASANAAIVKPTSSGLIGSGPYVMEMKRPGYVILKKNNFYAKSDQVKNHGLVFVSISDPRITNVLNKGLLDGAVMYKYNSIANVTNNSYRLILTNPNITELFVLNNQRFPFNYPIVRRALAAQVFNNSNMINCAKGARKAYGLIPNGLGGSIDNMPPSSLTTISPAQVFERVPQLKSKSVNVVVHQLEAEKNLCEAKRLQKVARAYHINLIFKYHKTYATLWPLYLNHKLDAFIDSYVFMNREASSVLGFFTKAGENDANITDSYADDLLNEAVSSASPVTRFTYYSAFAQYFQENAIVIPLFYMRHGNLIKKCIAGVPDNFYYDPFQYLIKLHRSASCAS